MKKLLLLALLLPALARAEIAILDPEGAAHPWLRGSVEELQQKVLRIDDYLPVVVQRCGVLNAYYVPSSRSVVMCAELFERVQRAYSEATTGGGIDKQAAARVTLGEVLFVLLHEVGHALMDIKQIPALGGGERAADMFAAYVLMRNAHPDVYIGALNFFAERSKAVRVVTADELTDSHGVPAQRRADLTCWGFGRDESMFAPFAAHQKIGEQRLRGCRREYDDMQRDVSQAFGAVLRR